MFSTNLSLPVSHQSADSVAELIRSPLLAPETHVSRQAHNRNPRRCFLDTKFAYSDSIGLPASRRKFQKREAKKMLAEAVSLYLETCFENNQPYFCPVPEQEDP